MKVSILIALVALYYALAGSTAWRTSFGRKIATLYEAGAIIALWVGGRPIGTLQPVSLRPIFVGLGIFLLLGGFILMLTTRDFARRLEGGSLKPAPGQVGSAPLFASNIIARPA
jgi:hypothetical protein